VQQLGRAGLLVPDQTPPRTLATALQHSGLGDAASVAPWCHWLLQMEACRYGERSGAMQLGTLVRDFKKLPKIHRVPNHDR
jgi:hypothetical protein